MLCGLENEELLISIFGFPLGGLEATESQPPKYWWLQMPELEQLEYEFSQHKVPLISREVLYELVQK